MPPYIQMCPIEWCSFYINIISLFFFVSLIVVCVGSTFSFKILLCILSYDVESGSEIMPWNRIDKPLVVYRSTGNLMTSITTLRT